MKRFIFLFRSVTRIYCICYIYDRYTDMYTLMSWVHRCAYAVCEQNSWKQEFDDRWKLIKCERLEIEFTEIKKNKNWKLKSILNVFFVLVVFDTLLCSWICFFRKLWWLEWTKNNLPGQQVGKTLRTFSPVLFHNTHHHSRRLTW